MSTIAPIEPTLERLSPEARLLLWVLSRATKIPVPETLVEKVFTRESVEDEKLRQIGRMMAAFERLPQDARPDAPAMPDEVRSRIAQLEEKADAPKQDLEPLVGELVEARLVSRAPLVDGGSAMGLSFTDDVTLAMTMWMEARPGEVGAHDDAAVRVAFGERYAAAFVAAVEGKIALGTTEAAIEAGTNALAYFAAAGAIDATAKMFGEAVRVANDAAIVGPVAFDMEKRGLLDALVAAFVAQSDALGEAGTLAALAGYRMDQGDRDEAIALELRSLHALSKLDNVVPRAIVHLRLSGLYEGAGRSAESGTHLAAAMIYRALAGIDFSAEIRELITRLGRDRAYELPKVRQIVALPEFAFLAAFIRSRRVPVIDVQMDLDALVLQVKTHIASEAAK